MCFASVCARIFVHIFWHMCMHMFVPVHAMYAYVSVCICDVRACVYAPDLVDTLAMYLSLALSLSIYLSIYLSHTVIHAYI